MSKKTFMTLKEAAEKSGYSADYIGQLIRSGKLQGEQMYSGVAWVTTEEALNEYLSNDRGARKSKFDTFLNYVGASRDENITVRFSRAALYVAIAIGALLLLVLFYILSLKLEHSFEQKGIQQIQSTRS